MSKKSQEWILYTKFGETNPEGFRILLGLGKGEGPVEAFLDVVNSDPNLKKWLITGYLQEVTAIDRNFISTHINTFYVTQYIRSKIRLEEDVKRTKDRLSDLEVAAEEMAKKYKEPNLLKKMEGNLLETMDD